MKATLLPRAKLRVLTAAIAAYLVGAGLAPGAGVAAELDKDGVGKLPEGQRGWYVEKEGKFLLDPSKIDFPDTSALNNALETERGNVRREKKRADDLATLAKKWEGLDPDSARELQKQLDADEELQLFKAGKKDELRQRWLGKYEEQKVKDLKARDDIIAAKDQSLRSRDNIILEHHLQTAATKGANGNQIHSSAYDDIKLAGRQVFQLDDNGRAIMKNEAGEIVMGKDGKTPYSPTDWLLEQVEARPHWFVNGNSGGGSGGDRGNNGGGGGRTMKRATFEGLDAAGKQKAIADKTTIVD